MTRRNFAQLGIEVESKSLGIASAGLEKLERQSGQTERATDRLVTADNRRARATEQSARATDRKRDANGRFIRSEDQSTRATNRNTTATDRNARSSRLAARAQDGLSAAASRAARNLLLTAASFIGFGAAIDSIVRFEDGMARVSAITGATQQEFEALRDTAKELGATTEFSASAVADGLGFLGMAGFDATESIAAMPAVLDLATGAAINLGQAADIASNIMSGFGIEAANATSAIDIMAAVATRANTNIPQLGRAMSQVAPVAAAAGISIEEVAAAVGVLSDAGIQGGRAGTAVRQAIALLVKPSEDAKAAIEELGLSLEQVNPNANSLTTIFQRFEAAGLDAARAARIFGIEGLAGALRLSSASAQLGSLTNELQNVDGAAADMADTMRDTIGGSFRNLVSAAEGLAIALGDAGVTAVIRGFVDALTTMIRVVTRGVSALSSLGARISEAFGTLTTAELASSALETAIDNTTIAIGDQINAARDLAAQIALGNVATISEVRAQLESARARRETINLLREERIERALASEAYQSILQEINDVRAARDALRAPGDDLAQMPLMMRDGFEQVEQQLVAALSKQQEFLAALREGTQLTAEESSALELIEANIAALEAKVRDYNAEKEYSVNLSGRLNAALDAVFGSTENATGAMARFRSGIASAVEAADALLNKILNIANAIPGVGSRLSALGSGIAGMLGGGDALDALTTAATQAATNLAGVWNGVMRTVQSPGFNDTETRSGGGGGQSSTEKAARETERLRTEYESLMSSLDPVFARTVELRDAEKLLADAMKAGIIDVDEKRRATDLLEESYQTLSSTAQRVQSDMASTFSSIIRGAESAKDAVGRLIDSLADMFLQQAFSQFMDFSGLGSAMGSFFTSLGFNARGTDNWRGGFSVVGEEGPELVHMPAGTRVWSNNRSRRIVSELGAVDMRTAAGNLQMLETGSLPRTRATSTPVRGGGFSPSIPTQNPMPVRQAQQAPAPQINVAPAEPQVNTYVYFDRDKMVRDMVMSPEGRKAVMVVVDEEGASR